MIHSVFMMFALEVIYYQGISPVTPIFEGPPLPMTPYYSHSPLAQDVFEHLEDFPAYVLLILDYHRGKANFKSPKNS